MRDSVALDTFELGQGLTGRCRDSLCQQAIEYRQGLGFGFDFTNLEAQRAARAPLQPGHRRAAERGPDRLPKRDREFAAKVSALIWVPSARTKL